MTSSKGVVVLCTAPRDVAREIAGKLVGERLAACVNIMDIRSIYWWEGEVQDDEESLLIIKTSHDMAGELERRILEIHPYEVPEIIVLEPIHIYEKYLGWVLESVSRG